MNKRKVLIYVGLLVGLVANIALMVMFTANL